MALRYSGTAVDIREVALRDKPADMIARSPKGTVPVLVLPDGSVIDESLDVMQWALAQHDPDDWLSAHDPEVRADIATLIERNDREFKPLLDRYKYWNRHPELTKEEHRQHAEPFLRGLEERLAIHACHAWLAGDRMTLADAALMPFIRQFALSDKPWFDQSPYPRLQAWLEAFMSSALFQDVMRAAPPAH